PPRLEIGLGEERVTGVTVLVQNATPYTFFGERPVQLSDGATLESGDLAGVVLQRASPIDMPTLIWRALSKRARVGGHRRVHPFRDVPKLTVRSLDGRPLPLQVDGDYIGEIDNASFGVLPRALTVVA